MGRRKEIASGEPNEIMDLVSGKPMETIVLGSGKLQDHPMVRRLRNRRLLIYLRLQGFHTAYDSVVRESGAQMSRLHLRQLVIRGRWSDAAYYIWSFLPPPAKERGRRARSLVVLLHALCALENVAACSRVGLVNDSLHADLRYLMTLASRNAKLSSILRYTLHPPHFRESLDWILVREKASLILDELVLDTPELRRKLQLPGGPCLPRDVLPISPCLPRRHRKEQSRRPKPDADAIAKCFLNTKRSLHSSSQPPASPNDTLNWVTDLIDGCLKAGKVLELHQEQLLQSNANEGASGTPLLQTMFGTMTNPAKNTGTSSVTFADAPTCTGRPNCTRCSSAANSGPIKCSLGRKRNRGEDFMTVEEDLPDKKKQRTELLFY